MNEMTSPAWSSPFPLAPGTTNGQAALAAFTFETDPQWIWAGVGFLILTELVFIGLGALALKVRGEGRCREAYEGRCVGGDGGPAGERRQGWSPAGEGEGGGRGEGKLEQAMRNKP